MKVCDRIRKSWLFAGVIVIASVYVLLTILCDLRPDTWRSQRLKSFFKKSDEPPPPVNFTTKKILFWNTMFGDPTFYFGKGDLFRDCPDHARKCFATHDRSYASAEDFDAILFHANELSMSDLPSMRGERQYYVFVNLESPENRPITQWRLEDNFFNLTMTYRLDSDITRPYGDVRRVKDGVVVAPTLQTSWDETNEEATGLNDTSAVTAGSTWDEAAMMKTRSKKTKSAVWFVSNCISKSKRGEYVNQLAQHIDVDIFGLCGKTVGCSTNRNCFGEVVEPRYYFYLSFENSMCQDYVTEKLYNALKYNVVPVVYGGANYSLFAPPKSYINALDFDSPKQLADYLKTLIAEPSEYVKYFEWKKSYAIGHPSQRVICQLCEYLHENNDTKSYSPLSAWYAKGKCPLQEKIKYLPYLTKKDLKKNAIRIDDLAKRIYKRNTIDCSSFK